jgi:patatin-like phospholipase/acyl hydrolase
MELNDRDYLLSQFIKFLQCKVCHDLNIIDVIHIAPKTSCKQNDQEKGFITFETFPQRIPFN